MKQNQLLIAFQMLIQTCLKIKLKIVADGY
jgi:hypothetical protein